MNISDAVKLLKWNKCLLNTIGLWPLKDNDFLFVTSFIFLTTHCCLEYADAIQYIFDLRYVLENLTESIVLFITAFKMGLYRIYKNRLSEVLKDIRKDYAKELYTTVNEEALFLKYNSMSRLFVKCIMVTTVTSTVLYFIKPLTEKILFNDHPTGNTSRVYVLPYHIRLYFDITEARTYYIIYACESVLIPIITIGYAATDSLLVTLILHVCGQFSILAYQVKNIVQGPESFHSRMKRIVIKHCRLMSITNNLHHVARQLLLLQLIGITSLLCLAGYNLVVNPATREGAQTILYIFYSATVVIELFGYCLIGECLITESSSMRDAFYDCEWYNMPSPHAKLLLICMSRSQKALVLTAGSFYTFSLESFTDVIKTSMAYLSVLRNFL